MSRLDPGASMTGAWQWLRSVQVPTATVLGLLVAAVAVNAALQPNFFDSYSLTSNFATWLPLVTIAVAQTIVVLTGGIDLSVGAQVTLVSVVSVRLMEGELSNLPAALAAGLAAGLACGLINGIVVAVVRLQPIVATFATSFVFAGAALIVLPKPGGSVPPEVTSAYRQSLVGLPVPLLGVLVVGLAWELLRRHRIGRHLYAAGGDPESAFASLVPVTAVRIRAYVIAGFFASLAAFAVLANSGAGDPFVGNELTLTSVAAVVIGGTALKGGRGGALGSMIGAVVLALVANIVFFADVPTTYRQLVNGAVVILALALAGVPALRKGTSR